MKTKKLFLKLFLAVCFLMAVPPREAKAATEVDLALTSGIIRITDTGIYVDASEGSQATTPTWSLSTSGYLLKNTPNGNAVIKVDVQTPVKLMFQNVSPSSNSLQLNIVRGSVDVEISGQNILRAPTGEPAVKISNTGASLRFTQGSPDNLLRIRGVTGKPPVEGGSFYVAGGNVMIHTGGGPADTSAFKDGTSIRVESGSLSCYNGTSPAILGNNVSLQQIGGYVTAEDIAYIDFPNERIQMKEPGNYDFSRNNIPVTINWSSGGVSIPENWHSSKIEVLPKTGTTGGYNQTFIIPERPDSPNISNISATNETTSGKHDGTISNITENMDIYRGENAPETTSPSWTNVANFESSKLNTDTNVLEGLAPGTYWLRYRSTSTSFASEAVTVSIARGGTIEASLKHTFEPRVYQYDDLPDSAGVSITNLDTTEPIIINGVTITNVKVNGKDSKLTPFAFVRPGNTRINAGRPDTSWQIRPVSGLEAGTYTADVKIEYKTYNEDPTTITLKDAVQFTVTKLPYPGGAKPDKPDAAKVIKVNYESIELEPIPTDENTKAKVEYGIYNADNIAWQSSPVFTGLDSEKDYQFVARYADSDNYEPSDRSEISDKIKTEKKASIVYSTKELSLIPNREYLISVPGGGEADPYISNKTNGNIDIDTNWFGKTIVLEDKIAGTSQKLDIPEIADAPAKPKGQAESFSSAGDGKLLGVSNDMEYKLKDSNDAWRDCGGNTVNDLAAGTYLVRTKAKEASEGSGYKFASQAKEVVIPRGNALGITPDTFDLGTSTYKVLPKAKAIAFRNHDANEDVTIKSIALSDDSPFTIIHKETDSVIVPAGKNNETFKIQPKADLNVGTYTDEFVVTFEIGYNPEPDDSEIQTQSEGFNVDSPDTSGEKSASIPVTFTVEKANQEPPTVPAEKSATSTSITLETIPNNAASGAKAQYSKDGGKSWQDSPTFTKLKADTEYYFVSRYAATENYNESEISAGEAAISTTEKGADKDDDGDDTKPQASGSSGSSGNSGTSGSSGNSGTSGNGTTGNNGTGTNGSNNNSGSGSDSDGSGSRNLTSAKTGDLNNIQLWVTLMIGSYLSCYLTIKNRIKKAKA